MRVGPLRRRPRGRRTDPRSLIAASILVLPGVAVPNSLSLGFLIGLAIVTGAMLFVWLRHRAAASDVDDASVLLAAPPPGMTPATAAMIMGLPTRAAFLTALLDLASRDEIGFVEEGVTH